MAEAYPNPDYANFSLFQQLHISYLQNVRFHFDFAYKLYIAEKKIPDNFKYYETELQPMILIPLFNATERMKALKEFFDKHIGEYPDDIISAETFPKFNFPSCWIKEKKEELVFAGKKIQLTYKYV